MKEINSVTLKNLIHKLKKYGDRFELDFDSKEVENLLSSCPEGLDSNISLRLRRNPNVAHWKTLLLVSINSIEQLRCAFRWAANVKDEIGISEGTDLYLIGVFENPLLSEDEILGYESNDLFCRKFFLRNLESVESLLDRTFLSSVQTSKESSKIDDPLSLALLSTARDNPSFDVDLWRKEFLSGKSGSELIDAIF